MKRKRGILTLALLCAGNISVVILLFAPCAWADVYPGRAVFNADRTIITIPYGMSAIVFDTSECENCRDSVPAWRFIGNLKVDSLIHREEEFPHTRIATAVTDSSQLEGIRIFSPDLVQALERVNLVRLHRRIPNSHPSDTLYWDSVRRKWHHLSDMSLNYRIVFDEKLEVDSVVNWLRQVPGMNRANRIDKPMPLDPILDPDSTDPGLIPQPKPDSLDEQGALESRSDPRADGSITLDTVVGMFTPGYLPADQSITFYLNVENNTGDYVPGIVNGFRIYSPDGAEWYYTYADTLPILAWGSTIDVIITIN